MTSALYIWFSFIGFCDRIHLITSNKSLFVYQHRLATMKDLNSLWHRYLDHLAFNLATILKIYKRLRSSVTKYKIIFIKQWVNKIMRNLYQPYASLAHLYVHFRNSFFIQKFRIYTGNFERRILFSVITKRLPLNKKIYIYHSELQYKFSASEFRINF